MQVFHVDLTDWKTDWIGIPNPIGFPALCVTLLSMPLTPPLPPLLYRGYFGAHGVLQDRHVEQSPVCFPLTKACVHMLTLYGARGWMHSWMGETYWDLLHSSTKMTY